MQNALVVDTFYAIERSNVRFSFRRVTMNIIFYVNLHAERFCLIGLMLVRMVFNKRFKYKVVIV